MSLLAEKLKITKMCYIILHHVTAISVAMMTHTIGEYFNYLGRILTNYAKCTREIKSRIAMTKAAFNKKKALFTSKLNLNLRRKLVKCYIRSIALYGAETWTLGKIDQKYLESFEMWCWRRIEKISWIDL
jgi:hypothetical protein